MWNLIIPGIVSGVKNFFALKQAKAEGEIKIIQTAAQNVADWEKVMAKASASSWKDEWWTMLWSIPLIGCFIGYEEEMMKGFDALAKMPNWYTYALITMVLASFGIRLSDKLKGMMIK